MYWNLKEVEEKLSGELESKERKILRRISAEAEGMENRSKIFILEKLGELERLLRKERDNRDARLEPLLRKIVKEELREKRYSREVRNSVDRMNAAVESSLALGSHN